MEKIWFQIGERLREAREDMGLSVADVAHQTRIHWSVIEALEAEDFSVFSSALYARSFLSQYSALVGVDASEWVASFESADFLGPDVLEPLLDSGGGGAARAAAHEETAAEATRAGGSGATLLVLCATGLLVFAAVAGYRFYEARFGDDAIVGVVEPVGSPAPVAPELALEPPELPQVVINAIGGPVDDGQLSDGESPPPPRAIIVQEP